MKAKSREFRGDEITKQGVFVDFTAELYENGKLTATMQAPKAVVDGDKRTVVASGGVKMKSMKRKTSLVADKVTWYAKDKKIVGSGGVKVNSTTGDITAAEIETDTMLSKIAVRGSR
jgi:lipopolysaccharide assembly outer membrane protein LptD (OstA)